MKMTELERRLRTAPRNLMKPRAGTGPSVRLKELTCLSMIASTSTRDEFFPPHTHHAQLS
jgi:hypothetical protein